MGKSKGTDKTWAAFVQRIHAAWERGELSLRVSQRHQNTMEEIKVCPSSFEALLILTFLLFVKPQNV